jgi:uncharacterized membrane protein
MRRFVSLALVPLALGLAACDPRAADSAGPPQPPADAPEIPAEFRADIRLVGTEPFWALRIAADRMVLSRIGQPDLTVTHAGPSGRADEAEWAGEGLTARVVRQVCSDGMSDRVYPYAATVEAGGQTLKGCGDAESAFPAPKAD